MKRPMKDVLLALVMVALSVPVLAGGRPDTVRTVFDVKGMHCDGCSATITATLEGVEGVVEASADHEAGRAEAVYHAREVDAEALKKEIEKLGYTVTAMTTETVEG